MAPTTGKRSAIRSRPFKTGSTPSNPIRHIHPKAQTPFSTSKKDKRIIKHSALISRIEKSKASPKKRRRPSKKLVADLESLAAALPDAPPKDEQVKETGIAKTRHRSLKSKPGAMKKKEKIISMEKDRFNRSMAHMATLQSSDIGPSRTGSDPLSRNKWTALRTLIQQSHNVPQIT
ncbi:MAG: hypothetical protein Q9166_006271 [cf. Caloplaca sp. 2 TL-2023]